MLDIKSDYCFNKHDVVIATTKQMWGFVRQNYQVSFSLFNINVSLITVVI